MTDYKRNTLKDITKAKSREDLRYYENMQAKDYIDDRLIYKIKLYFKFSRRCERAYRFIVFFTLLFGALVPIFMNWDYLNGYNFGEDSNLGKQLATFFSIIVIILVSFEATFKFRERLQNYKKTEDQLTHELYLFQSGTYPYELKSEEDNFRLLVFRVESIIREERDDTIEKATTEVVEKNKFGQ